MAAIVSFLRKAFGWFFAVLFALAGAAGDPPGVKTGELEFRSETAYPYSEGAAFCQGIAADGDFFYGTGCIKYLNYNAIVKIDAATGEILQYNDMCLPAAAVRAGYSHLGDCAYADGKIYAACEAFFFRNPAVMVFDAGTLTCEGWRVLPAEGRGNGHIPWVCVDGDTLYYTQARDVREVRMLNLSDFSYKGALALDTALTQITGGDVLNGTLYLSSNAGGSEKTTYAVDLATGKTAACFVRETGSAFTETEGLAIRKNGEEILFHYLDVAPVSQTAIRTYVFTG